MVKSVAHARAGRSRPIARGSVIGLMPGLSHPGLMPCPFRGFRARRRSLCVVARPREHSDQLRRHAHQGVLANGTAEPLISLLRHDTADQRIESSGPNPLAGGWTLDRHPQDGRNP